MITKNFNFLVRLANIPIGSKVLWCFPFQDKAGNFAGKMILIVKVSNDLFKISSWFPPRAEIKIFVDEFNETCLNGYDYYYYT